MNPLHRLLLAPFPAGAAMLHAGWRLLGREDRAREISERRGFVPASPPGPGPLWIQAASVGEALLAGRLAGALRRLELPGEIVVSTMTRTGQEMVRERGLGDRHFFFPLDTPRHMRRAVGRVHPRLYLSVETELWPCLLAELSRRRIPSGVVSGRLSPGSFRRLLRIRRILEPALRGLSHVAVGSDREAERFARLGARENRIVVTGSLKYDLEGEPPAPDQIRDGILSLGLDPACPVLVCGSTGEGEEPLVLDAFSRIVDHVARPVLVLAPRHPERFDGVARLVASRGWPWARRSAGPAANRARVLLLDTLGELSRLYGIARGAFVGGTLVPVGGHNLLEPSVLGVPVCFGPHTHQVEEMASALLEAGAADRIADPDGLARLWGLWLSDPGRAEESGRRGRRFVEGHRGATDSTARLVLALLRESDAREERRP